MATGGLYLGGGIAAKLLGPATEAPPAWRGRAIATFLRGLHGTSRLRPLLEAVPVKVMLNTAAPLIGAAHYALRSAAAGRADASGEAERT